MVFTTCFAVINHLKGFKMEVMASGGCFRPFMIWLIALQGAGLVV